MMMSRFGWIWGVMHKQVTCIFTNEVGEEIIDWKDRK